MRLVLLLTLALPAPPATSGLQVSATVLPACSVIAASRSLTVRCSEGVSGWVAIGPAGTAHPGAHREGVVRIETTGGYVTLHF